MKTQSRPAESAASLLAAGRLRTVFQPIVEVDGERIVGYEALVRGPQGSALELPGALMASAREEGILPAFDRSCRELALGDAFAAGLGRRDLVFINVEPEGLETGGILDRLAERHLGKFAVVVELTERALAARPREVLAAVRWLRERRCHIALDDVGVDHRSLALMPFISPDVIKVDRRLVHGELAAAGSARVLNAVRAEVERSGALILAEGVETRQHYRRACAMGATLAQGWMFGRPRALLDLPPPGHSIDLPHREPQAEALETPFTRLAGSRRVLRGDKRLLLSLSRQLEQEALGVKEEAVVISSFQEASFFTPATRRRYEQLARSAALVAAIGVDMDATPGAGIRGASLRAGDPLHGEWNVIVVGPHFAAAFVARDLGDDRPDEERRFDYFVTYDRGLVVEAASLLLGSVVPSS
ncbi:MAG: EAL domain-containing protein [Solirubrobacterales bacterium]